MIPLNDLSRMDFDLRGRVSKKAADLSVSGKYILGSEVAELEATLAEYLKIGDCIGVATGTDALSLSLLAIGVGQGDTVLTAANAGAYATLAAIGVGAQPIFVDVSEDSLQISISELEKSLNISKKRGLKPKAVIVTHLFGQLNLGIEAIAAFTKREGLFLIEDCAQALGARSASGMAGSFGDLSTFSFYPTKNLGAAGDGGAVGATRVDLALRVRKLRQYGWGERYKIEVANGRNSRLDEIQAAILNLKFPLLDSWNQKRRDIYASYVQSASPKVKFFSEPNHSFVGHLAPITVENMTQVQLREYFRKLGILTSIHFPTPDHKQPINLQHADLISLEVTEKSCSSLITLPIFPEMTRIEVSRVCDALSKVSK